MEQRSTSPDPTLAAWLGFGGLIPLLGLTAAALLGAAADGSTEQLWKHALFGYGAVILSFTGALHWGFAMSLPDLTERRRNRALLWSVVPALIAWVALLMHPLPAAACLVAGFALQYGQDRTLTQRSTFPTWYLPLRLRLTCVACLCLAVSGFAGRARAEAQSQPTTPAQAAQQPLYRTAPASEDGIGKFYDGREIAQVMGFEGAEWLERPTRQQEERPDLLIAALHLEPGMAVADIGAGSGYLSRRMAPLVAPGRVYPVDVQPQMVALLQRLAKAPGFANIVPTQSSPDDVNLPAASLDLAIMVDVYHELAFPYEVMQSVVRALKPGGRMVFVEYRGEDPKVPIKLLHKMTEPQVRLEMRRFPLRWERTSETLPLQHIVIFRKLPAA